jgi:RNA polymerase sigma-70 factor (ECF subfamily)
MTERPDHAEFAQWFVPNQRHLFGFILSVVPNLNEAEEIFQETCLVLWKKAGEFDAQREFRPWACGVAMNVIRNRRAKHVRDRHVFNESLVAQIAEVQETQRHWLDDRMASLAQCLERLSQSQRKLLDRAYGEERSGAELAALEGITVNALHQRLTRIRQRLFECVNRLSGREVAL